MTDHGLRETLEQALRESAGLSAAHFHDDYDALVHEAVNAVWPHIERALAEANRDSMTWYRDAARRVYEFGCSCGDTFDSLEAHDEHQRMVHSAERQSPAAPAQETQEPT